MISSATPAGHATFRNKPHHIASIPKSGTTLQDVVCSPELTLGSGHEFVTSFFLLSSLCLFFSFFASSFLFLLLRCAFAWEFCPLLDFCSVSLGLAPWCSYLISTFSSFFADDFSFKLLVSPCMVPLCSLPWTKVVSVLLSVLELSSSTMPSMVHIQSSKVSLEPL